METLICPYCECRVRVREVDDEGGVCPECGAIITSDHLVEQDIEADERLGHDEEGLDFDDRPDEDGEDEEE
ncbi:MAG: hypothetical protein BWZ02_02495 [Lentisphaerae bacterium ADurb.BinA184]|nr:MAG: hypothetical protein BWZ02_02495 [Lentisphaerae bacterium ADurb.BinA184]